MMTFKEWFRLMKGRHNVVPFGTSYEILAERAWHASHENTLNYIRELEQRLAKYENLEE